MFPWLGWALFTGDSGVRGDLFHLICLIKDSCTPGHPSWAKAQEELLLVFKIHHQADLADWLATKAGKLATKQKKNGEPTKEPPVRYLMPPPHKLLPDFMAWATRHIDNIDATSGELLFTLETVRIVEATMKQIIKWYFSCECWCCLLVGCCQLSAVSD